MIIRRVLTSVLIILFWVQAGQAGTPNLRGSNPFLQQVAKHEARLQSKSPEVRAGACENLGYLRAYQTETNLIECLSDSSPIVRRQAAMALAWCGGRPTVVPLLEALNDDDWVTRQSAHISLTNLTGKQFPFDAMAPLAERKVQATKWRDWWSTIPRGKPLIEATKQPRVKQKWAVTVSSTYKGPPEALVDGQIGPEFWQTKGGEFPQWCTIDLGSVTEISRVAIYQHGPAFVLTDYELATSLDERTFEPVERRKTETDVKLIIDFPKRKARFVRITSHDSKRSIYPTTFYEVEIGDRSSVGNLEQKAVADIDAWHLERKLRALGSLGGNGATDAVLAAIGPIPSKTRHERIAMRTGIRALGRLREEPGFDYLIGLLNDPMWARHAADALGDFGDPRAVTPLLAAYQKYCKTLNGANPRGVPSDDRMGFPSEDRMLETPYLIAYSLCRLPLNNPEHHAELRKIAPLIMANLPGDHDAMMLYQQEVGHLLTRHLLDSAGLRQEACEHAFSLLGQPPRTKSSEARQWSNYPAYRISSWLPAVCTEREDIPRLLALLAHENRWVRLNAAKTLGWIGDERSAKPIADLLANARSEADYGLSGTFKDEEFNDPAPRWREGLLRALGQLGDDQHIDLIVKVLNDEDSVLEVRHAAADALVEMGSEKAIEALHRAATSHAFASIRHIARDALPTRKLELPKQTAAHVPVPSVSTPRTSEFPKAVVFIKGSNDIPNTKGTVEQADRWRQTYVVTDSGPVYRPGRNLYVLSPPQPDGKVTPLTRFADGYVGEPELSWDAKHVIFTHRGQDDPWWHLYRIGVDGEGLTQLTDGPYHDVGPAYLPDGRIVFTSSRSGIRDEYHGYLCSALYVMNADGTDMHSIATNIGRDNEPALLHDGRIVFSRLEVFYSRNKTELTLHTARPDGTDDRVIYGPERRLFWRTLDHGAPTPSDRQEAPLTHRVLRITQPQPMPNGRDIITVTQGGLTLIGPNPDSEKIISPDNKTRSYTTPWPLPDGRLLCASTLKTPDRKQVDLGLYLLNPVSQKLKLIYNDPETADFEARPIVPRKQPPVLPVQAKRGEYSGQFLCASVFATREEEVRQRGKFVRLIEGVPVVGRHSTQTNPEPAWKNHGGTLARVLGTVPLAADGSFYVEVPADRLLHFQVLDSDRRVVGNQLTWIYARAGESRSCVGCHERPNHTAPAGQPQAVAHPPVSLLPNGDEFNYRAKAWFKGHLPREIEERTRTVRGVNLLGR